MDKIEYLLPLLEFLRNKTVNENGFEHPELKINFSEIQIPGISSKRELKKYLTELKDLLKLGNDPHTYRLFTDLVNADNSDEFIIKDITTARIKEAYKKISGGTEMPPMPETIICDYTPANKTAIIHSDGKIIGDFTKGRAVVAGHLYKLRNDNSQSFHTLGPIYVKDMHGEEENHTLTSNRLNQDVIAINTEVKAKSGGSCPKIIETIPGKQFNYYKWIIT